MIAHLIGIDTSRKTGELQSYLVDQYVTWEKIPADQGLNHNPFLGKKTSCHTKGFAWCRMQRNRESASLSRQRRKMLSEEKENQVQELQKHCAGLTGGQQGLGTL